MLARRSKNIILVLVLLGIGGAIFYLEQSRPQGQKNPTSGVTVAAPSSTATVDTQAFKASRFALAKEFAKPGRFINSEPFSLQSLVGKKVILLDFWTYSCINCERTLPYLNAWYTKYKDYGLEIIGVHTPEFGFEKEYENVLAAVKKFGIAYPVVQDNDYGIWSAYNNHYWPHEFLIDIDGYVVHDTIGEGGYAETENAIQQALQEKMAREGATQRVAGGLVAPTGTAAPQAQSPETYFGAARNEYLGNGRTGATGAQTLQLPATGARNELLLGGQWNFEPEFASAADAGAKIRYQYKAAGVYFVASAPTPVRIEVLRDGAPLTPAQAGADITFADGKSYLTVSEDRLYKIISEPNGVSEHTLTLIILQPGLKAYTFTFG